MTFKQLVLERESLSRDKLLFLLLSVSCLLILLEVGLILVNLKQFPPKVPVFYSMPWGEKMLGAPIFLWIFPSISIVCVVINFAIISFLSDENKFLKRSLGGSAAVIVFSSFYGLFKIVELLI
ncbi:hypothetical protein HY382_01510 [Candidatus Curtissbacteria bacterium]|nr:hypothetical protein [Candidatus Curtissbacteria bacterium]